ncbi:hypothetical protein AB6A40_004029 [Gnathostoma spinigerum]|uniref:Uncharacterized protein n=1 Tax=Gnathostoma spinigerum TaxID=75299 RepID=A0ABD6ECF4_9BILA
MASGSSVIPTRHDPVELWKRASLEKVGSADDQQETAISRSSIVERLSGKRSVVWTSLSQMAPIEQADFMRKLVGYWPYKVERRAVNWPIHLGILTNCITSSRIATAVNADMFLFKADTPFLEAVRQCPKSPLVFGIYTSGILYYVFQQEFVYNILYREDRPKNSSVLSRYILSSLVSGIVLPVLSTPYISYYVMLNQRTERYPQANGLIEFLCLCWESSKSVIRILPRLMALQLGASVIGTYCVLWGRNRIFDSMDADPDLVRDTMILAQSSTSLKYKLEQLFKRVPFIGRVFSGTEENQ